MDFTGFRERLVSLMHSRGFNIARLSEEVNITAAALSRYTNGHRRPELEYVIRLAQYFNVSVDWILGISDDKYNSLSPEIQEIVELYSLSSKEDRRIIQAVLDKYRED